MSIRLTVKSIHVTVEGDDPQALASLAGQITSSLLGGVVSVAALPATASPPSLAAPKAETRVGRFGTKRVPRRASPAPRATSESDEAILAALRFRPLRVTELADALCEDKREVAKAVPRLYWKLKRLVRDGQVVKDGREFAVKRK